MQKTPLMVKKRIGHYDGYSKSTNTVLEFHGCFSHGHRTFDDPKKWQKTQDRETELMNLGYKVISITSCEWQKNPASKKHFPSFPV